MELTKHFTLNELTYSPTAIRKHIDNTPDETQVKNLVLLAKNVLEPLRLKLDKPVKVNSGFRCPTLNKAIGGARTSQHMEGKAADIYVPDMTVEELFIYITENFKFDQCIQEFDS